MNISPQMVFASPIELYRSIRSVWSGETASPPQGWSCSNPARNHCSVTALIVQDYFGGEILTTKTTGGTHYYNLINGQRWDLTISQFAEPIAFDDRRSSREAAMKDTTPDKYRLITERLASLLSRAKN